MATDKQTDLILKEKGITLKKLMEASRKEIAMALPKHVTADRMLRIALTEARKNPDLLECDQASFLGAIIQASQLGLEPGSALGHCWLIPFNNSKKNIKECQFMVGYRGMIDLAMRSEKVSHVIARAVYSGDDFSYRFGLQEMCEHKPKYTKDEILKYVYAIVFLKNGSTIFDVMGEGEVGAVRQRSQSKDKGPWVTDYEAMAKKSVIRRLFKYMPLSVELQKSVGYDEMADAGESQENANLLMPDIETTGTHVPTDEGSVADQMKAKVAASGNGKAPAAESAVKS